MSEDIARVLERHQLTSKLLSPSDVRTACLCGAYVQDDELPTFHNEWHIAHQTAALAPLLSQAWGDGAETAWARSTPTVNGLNYQWRHEGEPTNPYRTAP